MEEACSPCGGSSLLPKIWEADYGTNETKMCFDWSCFSCWSTNHTTKERLKAYRGNSPFANFEPHWTTIQNQIAMKVTLLNLWKISWSKLLASTLHLMTITMMRKWEVFVTWQRLLMNTILRVSLLSSRMLRSHMLWQLLCLSALEISSNGSWLIHEQHVEERLEGCNICITGTISILSLAIMRERSQKDILESDVRVR